jgi:hypothetical protein
LHKLKCLATQDKPFLVYCPHGFGAEAMSNFHVPHMFFHHLEDLSPLLYLANLTQGELATLGLGPMNLCADVSGNFLALFY